MMYLTKRTLSNGYPKENLVRKRKGASVETVLLALRW